MNRKGNSHQTVQMIAMVRQNNVRVSSLFITDKTWSGGNITDWH